MAKKFPSKTPDEIKLCTFDFSNEVAAGSTIATPAVAKSLVSGDDVGAASLTIGTPAIAPGTALVKVLIGGGTTGSIYRLLATTDASNAEKHQLAGTMKVAEDAA